MSGPHSRNRPVVTRTAFAPAPRKQLIRTPEAERVIGAIIGAAIVIACWIFRG